MAHYDIFRDQLGIRYPALGHALWEPNPGLYSPVEVGDVGYIRDGKFHRLFNALLPADHPSHQRFGVPENYEPLRPDVAAHIDSGTLSPNDFCSHGVTTVSGGLEVFATEPVGSADVSFVCARKSGAVLSLPVTARREDTVARGDFAKWITSHIDTWFAFTRHRGLGIEMEDITFVTGHHRTRSSTNIAFYEGQAVARVSFGVQVTNDVGTSVNWQVTRRHVQGAMLSQGPSGDNLPEDQCIFVRGFRVARVFKLFPRLRGAAGDTPDPSGDDYEPELEVVSTPSFTKYRDPLHVLSEYVAERAPNCDLVLVHDDDLDRLRKISDGTSLETLQPDAVVNCLQRSEPEISQITCDSLSSESDIPSTSTRESKIVALFSEELSSWAGPSCLSQWWDSFPPDATTPSSTKAATPHPQPQRPYTRVLQPQPLELQPQPLTDEARNRRKRLVRKLFLWILLRIPSRKRDTEPDGLGRFSNVSTIGESSETRTLLETNEPAVQVAARPSSQEHGIVPSSMIPFTSTHSTFPTTPRIRSLPPQFPTPSPYTGLNSATHQSTAIPHIPILHIPVSRISIPHIASFPTMPRIRTPYPYTGLNSATHQSTAIPHIPSSLALTSSPSLMSTQLPSGNSGESRGLPVDSSWPEQKSPRVMVRGMFRQDPVEVECKLIIPVSYPVSDVIPLRLVITSETREALELLAVSHAIDVRLLKVLAVGENAANINPLTLRNRSSLHHTDWTAKAQWEADGRYWELPSSDDRPRARWRIKLNGQLHRDQSVKIFESFEQPGLALMYFVCLFPFRSTDFVPSIDPNRELCMAKLPITK